VRTNARPPSRATRRAPAARAPHAHAHARTLRAQLKEFHTQKRSSAMPYGPPHPPPRPAPAPPLPPPRALYSFSAFTR
jgi:hypothetical protein